jgi:hypothetical protein
MKAHFSGGFSPTSYDCGGGAVLDRRAYTGVSGGSARGVGVTVGFCLLFLNNFFMISRTQQSRSKRLQDL